MKNRNKTIRLRPWDLWKHSTCFAFTLSRRNQKTQQSPVTLDLCLNKNSARKISRLSNLIVFIMFSVYTWTQSKRSNSSTLKRVLTGLFFLDGLGWTEGLNWEIKSRFLIPPIWKAFWQAMFSRRIGVDCRPKLRNKTQLSNSSGWKSVLTSSVFVTD